MSLAVPSTSSRSRNPSALRPNRHRPRRPQSPRIHFRTANPSQLAESGADLGPIPDGIEPIVGFRAWFYRLTESGPHLYPICSRRDVIASSPWDGGESEWVVASCGPDPVDPGHMPAWECTCGFYATKTLPTLLRAPFVLMSAPGERRADCGWILGRVELAGKIIEHDDGYRAEKARIAELIPIEGDEPNSVRLAALLGLTLGDPVAVVRLPPPPYRWLPPNGPSTPRLRVRDWVQDVAA